MKRNSVFILMLLLLAPVLFLSQQSTANNFNGFSADPGSFEILSSYQGKSNVLKVDRSKTDYFIASYPLGQYRGKEIFIELSADVRREGSAGDLIWQVSNPNNPEISGIDNDVPGQWHSMKGSIIVTPAQNDVRLFLTNWRMPSNTTVYIANPVITITEGNPLTPDLSLIPLKTIYANDFLIGNETTYAGIYMSGKYFDLFKHHFNAVAFDAVFPGSITPSNKGGAYQFTNADNILNTAIRNNMYVYGHILVWHADRGGDEVAWRFEGTREDVIQNLNNHVTTVVRHFRGKINSWSVVNEALKRNVTNAEARGDWRRCIVNGGKPGQWEYNQWFNILGADYIELAFRAARAADPNVTLYYNDDFKDANMAEAARKMILDINDRYKRETGGTRNLIEGVGIQGHIEGVNYNVNTMRAILQKFTDLGIEIAITELDISTVGFSKGEGTRRDTVMSEREARAQAVLYARLFSLFREYSAHIKFVIIWGIDDRNSALSIGNPTLFDWKLNAKPAFHAVSDPDGFLRQNRR